MATVNEASKLMNTIAECTVFFWGGGKIAMFFEEHFEDSVFFDIP